MTNKNKSQELKQKVREHYAEIANQVINQRKASCCSPETATSCCSADGHPSIEDPISTNLYTKDEIGSLPDSVSQASLGCGNPIAIADLKQGETVLDLGSGGGIDCFLAAKKVGDTGRVIGLDMTPKMLDLARANARKMGLTNVDFQYGYMEDIPLPKESVDAIISNCVINLSSDKDAVFREAFRVLKPGGRIYISDMVMHGSIPPAIQEKVELWAGCIAGALEQDIYLGKMRAAGLTAIEITSLKYFPISEIIDVTSHLQEGIDLKQFDQKLASITLKAYKPF